MKIHMRKLFPHMSLLFYMWNWDSSHVTVVFICKIMCKIIVEDMKKFFIDYLYSIILGLNRRNMIALALLLGCDYLPGGVPGVGKETAIKLLSFLTGVDLLDRYAWKSLS